MATVVQRKLKAAPVVGDITSKAHRHSHLMMAQQATTADRRSCVHVFPFIKALCVQQAY